MLLTRLTLPINPVELADCVADHCVIAAANLDELLARAQSDQQRKAIQEAMEAYNAASAAMFTLSDRLEALAVTDLRNSVAIL